MLHQADILLGYLQLLDQRLVDGKRCFAEKELGGGGHQRAAGDATMLYYMTEEAQEGGRAFLEKRKPDWSKFPKMP